MHLGVCYYPEHWNDATWKPDAKRMRELGLTFVRVGEFAWSRLEPEPGRLHFDWLDRAVDSLGDAGLKVILGTPTATPPKWLVDLHPDILPVDKEGRRRGFGSRRHYCFSSKSYHRESERIVTLLAERYASHGAVAAWQTDNEYGCHDTVRSYSEGARDAFRDWLRVRYGSVERLNEAWWNVFWSMEYRDFAEIELPNLTVTEPNPSQLLDCYRFSSDAVVAYNKLQVDIIREHDPKAVISHNATAYFGDYDHFKLARDLDVITWDSYPLGMLEESSLPDEVKLSFMRSGHPDMISLMHDLYRGVKRRPFWVMEQQPGPVNWARSNPLPAPGMVRLWTHQAFAHGADLVSIFRWRAAAGAQELMHAGLNHADGRPDRASAEIKQVARELPDEPETVTAPVALLMDYENLWATDIQKHAEGWSYWGLLGAWHAALRSLGQDVDIIHPQGFLTGYRLVLAPALHLVDEALAQQLRAYVGEGGHLVLGPRSGSKTTTNLVQAPAPGPLSSLMGAAVHHVDALRPGAAGQVEMNGESYAYETWADLLTPTSAEVLATFATPAYAGTPALTRNRVGLGLCTTLGAWGGRKLNRAVFGSILATLELAPLELPEGLRLSRRGGRLHLFNFTDEVQPLGGIAGLPEVLAQAGSIGAHDLLMAQADGAS
ncbi:beta-galactosidase [soil metagenome]